MKISVLTYVNTANPLGFPDAWPSEVRYVADDAIIAAPYVEMTQAQLDAVISQNQAQVQSIIAAHDAIPAEVQRWQLRAALKVLGLFTQVEAIIANIPEPQQTILREKWNGQDSIRSDSQTIRQIGALAGLTNAQIDNVFKTASSLT